MMAIYVSQVEFRIGKQPSEPAGFRQHNRALQLIDRPIIRVLCDCNTGRSDQRLSLFDPLPAAFRFRDHLLNKLRCRIKSLGRDERLDSALLDQKLVTAIWIRVRYLYCLIEIRKSVIAISGEHLSGSNRGKITYLRSDIAAGLRLQQSTGY